MACLRRSGDRVERRVELLSADLRECWLVEIDERRADRRRAIKRLQSGAREGKVGDVGRGRVVGLFAQFEVDNQYPLVGCDKTVETTTVAQVGSPRPRQKSR